MTLDSLGLQLCDVQGRLFELSASEGYDSEPFVEAFMTGPVAAAYDRTFDRSQWMGPAFLLDETADEAGGLPRGGESLSRDSLYWMGYCYRYWHLLTGEPSQSIYARADASTMDAQYPGLHTISLDLAVERLVEQSR